MVDADAHGGVVLLADIDKRHELLLNLQQFGLIFLVSIFQVTERAAWVDVVAGIDAHLLAVLCGDVGGVSREVDIGHQRCVVAVSLQTCRDVFHILSLARALCGETHQFASGIDDALGLCHRTFRVVRVGGGHRLDADGVVAADGDVANVADTANSSCMHISLRLSRGWLSQSWLSDRPCSRRDAALSARR